MPGIDLSSLSGPELRRLLKVAAAREDAGLADQLRAELAARGAGGQPPLAARRPQPPPAQAETPDQSGHMVWREAPLELNAEPSMQASASRAAPGVGVGLLAAGVAVAALVWGLNGREPAHVEAPVQPSAPRAMVARVAPQVSGPQTAPPPVRPAVVEAERPATPASPRVRVAKIEPSDRKPPAKTDPCAKPPTPADRLVCKDLALAGLHHEMREAYVRALNAHADPYVVGEGQAAWRRVRDAASDPQSLAELYDRRIHELNRATAAARAEQPPY